MTSTARPKASVPTPAPRSAQSPPSRATLQREGPRVIRRHFQRAVIRVIALIISDVTVFVLMRQLVYGVRDDAMLGSTVAGWAQSILPRGLLGGWAYLIALLLGLLVTGNYREGDDRRSPRLLLFGSAGATALVLWHAIWTFGLSAMVPTYVVVATLVWLGLVAERITVDWFLRRTGFRRPHVSRTVLVGSPLECAIVSDGPAFANQSEYAVVAYVTPDDIASKDSAIQAEVRRTLLDARAETVVACGMLSDDAFATLVETAREAGCALLAVPRQFSVTGVEPQLTWRRGQPLIELTSPALKGREQVLKRFLDVVGAVAGLALLSPLFGAVAIAVKLDSEGPVFYRSPRWGRFGRTLSVWKFRTMVDGADALLEGDPALNSAYRANIKLVDDPRVTRVGRFLRRWSIDELPQLINVLTGDMSLVGPRPKLIGEEEKYGAALETVLAVRPGLTGLWQISGRSATTYDERIALDVQYVSHLTFWDDLVILLRTLPVVLSGAGAH